MPTPPALAPATARYRLVTWMLIAVLAAVLALNGWGSFYTDIKPEVYLAPWRMVPRLASAWTASPYLGSPNLNVGLLPVVLLLAPLRALGLNPEWTFKVFHFLLWLAAAFGVHRLVRQLAPQAGRWAALLAAVLYLANPYAVTAGDTLAIALPMAVLPWWLLAVYRGLTGGGWRWPLVTGLAWFAMSGMNVGVVPILQALAVVPIVLLVRPQVGWASIHRRLLMLVVVTLGVSCYWLVPSFQALGTGSQIVQGSETLAGISKVSSLVEVLRGLGLWAIYGKSASGPWVPQVAIFLISPVVIMVTALWPALSLAALRWVPARLARGCAAGMVVAAVVMVGLYPLEGSSPLAWLLKQAYTNIGPLLAFRTTNKAGAVLVLYSAIGLGVGASRVLPSLLQRDGAKPIVVSLVSVLALGWTVPVWTNRLYISQLDIPNYWREAAAVVDRTGTEPRPSSVLLLPGQTRSMYRWSQSRPDDLPNSLLDRDAIIPETAPNTSRWGGNLLAALDESVQSEGPANVVSTFARYLGADRVLMRNDVAWEEVGGGDPSKIATAVSSDTGLVGWQNFGLPGENTVGSQGPPRASNGALLPPLQLYGVNQPTGQVRADRVARSRVIVGDGWAIPALLAAGRDPAGGFRYAADLTTGELEHALKQGAGLVLTDTNVRRNATGARLTANQGQALSADTPLGLTRTLGDNPADQTVLTTAGVQARASDQGGAFFDVPAAAPQNAIDGNPDTAWLFGDFRRAVGQSITLQLPQPTRLGTISISQAQVGSVHLNQVEVSAGPVRRTVTLPDQGSATVDLSGVTASEVAVRVDSIRGDGFSLVGIAEIDLGSDLTAERSLRLPRTLSDRYAQLDTAGKQSFARAPLDILLTRIANTSSPDDDTEANLRRTFELPTDRTLGARALVRANHPDQIADRLAGFDPRITVGASGFAFTRTGARPSQAADNNPNTAWIPATVANESMVGAWWEITGPRRAISGVTVTQRPQRDARSTQYATQVKVLVDGKPAINAAIRPGTNRLSFPEVIGRQVRLVIERTQAGGLPAQFPTIDTGISMQPGPRQTCLPVATLDDTVLRMRPTTNDIAGIDQPGTLWRGCAPTKVSGGKHEVTAAPGIVLDQLALLDPGATRTAPATVKPGPPIRVQQRAFEDLTVDVGQSAGPYLLSIGTGFDPRWQASSRGKDLGKPIVVNGYAVGWLITDQRPQVINISYRPQHLALLAGGVSAAVLLLALMAARSLQRERRRTGRADTAAEPIASPQPVSADLPAVTLPQTPGRIGSRTTGRIPSAVRRSLTITMLGGFVLGLGGLAGGLLSALFARRLSAARQILLGAAIVVLATACYILLARDQLAEISADSVSTAWPAHQLAATGLVLAVAGVFRKHDARQMDGDNAT